MTIRHRAQSLRVSTVVQRRLPNPQLFQQVRARWGGTRIRRRGDPAAGQWPPRRPRQVLHVQDRCWAGWVRWMWSWLHHAAASDRSHSAYLGIYIHWGLPGTLGTIACDTLEIRLPMSGPAVTVAPGSARSGGLSVRGRPRWLRRTPDPTRPYPAARKRNSSPWPGSAHHRSVPAASAWWDPRHYRSVRPSRCG